MNSFSHAFVWQHGCNGSRVLLDVRNELRIRHYSRRTEVLSWMDQAVCLVHGKRHLWEMGPQEIQAFLGDLAVARRVSASTQNQAMSAILFLYREVLGMDEITVDMTARAKRPERLPVVLTKQEVRAVLGCMKGAFGLVAGRLYGAGLRLMECLTLRVKGLDFSRNEIVVRDGKGRKDRITMLPEAVKEPLRLHLERAGALHERDLGEGAGGVALPDASSNESIPVRVESGAGNGPFLLRVATWILKPGSSGATSP